MPASAVVIREKTRNSAKLDEYRKLAPASFEKHPVKFLAIHGRSEVLEGPKSEDIIILEFPNYEAAQAWYHSPEYQAALRTPLPRRRLPLHPHRRRSAEVSDVALDSRVTPKVPPPKLFAWTGLFRSTKQSPIGDLFVG